MRAKVKMPTAAEEQRIQAGIAADPDTFKLSETDMAKMRPATEVMPAYIYAELAKPRRGRGPGKKLAKALVTLRVEPDVLAGLRASGPGWQVRAGAALAKLAAAGSGDRKAK